MTWAQHEDMARFGGHVRFIPESLVEVVKQSYRDIYRQWTGAPMPESEETEPDIEKPAKEDKFPELWTARKIGRLMEDEPEPMRAFLLGWLNARYGSRG